MKKETKIGLIITALVVVLVVILWLREGARPRPEALIPEPEGTLFPTAPEGIVTPPAPEMPAPVAGPGLDVMTIEITAAPEQAVPTVAGPGPEGQVAPAAPVAPPQPAQTYTVAKGDTLSDIAQKFYGDSSKWSMIYEANKNQITDVARLQIGQVLTIPSASSAAAPAAAIQPAPAGAPLGEAVKAQRTHVVEKGDTLYGIAQKYYGDGSQWRKILSANSSKLSSPSELRPGMELVIP